MNFQSSLFNRSRYMQCIMHVSIAIFGKLWLTTVRLRGQTSMVVQVCISFHGFFSDQILRDRHSNKTLSLHVTPK